MANIYNMADTWNDGGTSFTAIKMNVTDSASASDSLLMDLQVGGSSKFSVRKDGVITNSNGGMFYSPVSNVNFFGTAGTVFRLGFSNNGFRLGGSQSITWSSATNFITNFGITDLILTKDAAGTLGQRNGTNAQTFNLYNTYTDASNYERGALSWDIIANALVLQPQKAGTGVSREMWIRGVGGSYARFKTDNEIDVSGGGGVNVTFKNSTTDFLDTPVIKTAETVATLPGTPEVGMMARVTDASSPTVGSTVTGDGSTAALVWYNGTNWTVIGTEDQALVQSDTTGVTGADAITNIISLTQAEYDAITPDAATFYVITG